MKDPKIPKAEGNKPHFEVYHENEEEKDENNAKEGQEEAAGEEKDGEDPMEIWVEKDEVKEGGEEKKRDALVQGGAPPEPPYFLPPPEKKEREEELKPGGFDIKIFRLAAPMITKIAREVSKTAMDFIFNSQNGWLPHWKSTFRSRSWVLRSFPQMGQLTWHSADTHTWRWSSNKWPCGGGSEEFQNINMSAAQASRCGQRILAISDSLCRCLEQKLAAWRCSKHSTFHTGRPCEASQMETGCLRAHRGNCQISVSCS